MLKNSDKIRKLPKNFNQCRKNEVFISLFSILYVG